MPVQLIDEKFVRINTAVQIGLGATTVVFLATTIVFLVLFVQSADTTTQDCTMAQASCVQLISTLKFVEAFNESVHHFELTPNGTVWYNPKVPFDHECRRHLEAYWPTRPQEGRRLQMNELTNVGDELGKTIGSWGALIARFEKTLLDDIADSIADGPESLKVYNNEQCRDFYMNNHGYDGQQVVECIQPDAQDDGERCCVSTQMACNYYNDPEPDCDDSFTIIWHPTVELFCVDGEDDSIYYCCFETTQKNQNNHQLCER